MPSMPSKLFLGTRTLSKTSSQVSWPRMPTFFSSLPLVKPGVLAFTMSSQKLSSQIEGIPVSTEELSEDVLRKLEFDAYEVIEKSGGIPVVITASGQQMTLHPKLYNVRKDSCKKTHQSPLGWFECSLTITLSLKEDGGDPSEQDKRIGVKWDPKGEWVRQ